MSLLLIQMQCLDRKVTTLIKDFTKHYRLPCCWTKYSTWMKLYPIFAEHCLLLRGTIMLIGMILVRFNLPLVIIKVWQIQLDFFTRYILMPRDQLDLPTNHGILISCSSTVVSFASDHQKPLSFTYDLFGSLKREESRGK